ncbi:MAG: hydroxymethylbilane synthase [Burkholderiales bacterium]|nr:hydroxymethylbilane synthase [Burkholderiales bacterium]
MSKPMKLTIASRESRLALWQAEHVKNLIEQFEGKPSVEILGMTTRGDQILDRALSKVGGKGLFIKELEVALLEGHADLAVHSAKDVPMDLEPEFELLGFMKREDPRDAFISSQYASLSELPEGSVVGTSSLRRQAQLLALFPHLKIEALRGNLDTRFGKLDRGEYAAIILAAAGVKRLGLAHRIRDLLPQSQFLPAAGQGALALEIPANRADLQQLLAPLLCPQTTAAVRAERQVSRLLGGSCQVPLAAYAEITTTGSLHLRARVANPQGTEIIYAEASGSSANPEQLGQQVGEELLAKGGKRILALCQSAD